MASELEVGKLKVAASDGAGGLVHENASGIKVGTDSNTTIGFIGTISNHPLKLLANNDGKVTIDASGRVGVGVAPGAKLHVSSGTTNNIADDLSEIRFIGPDKAITGEQANVVIQTNDDFAINKGGSIGLGGRHTTSSTNGANFAQISGRKENATTANFAGYLAFSTSDAASDIHERMRISSTGAVQIGADDIQGDAKLGVRRNGDAFNFGHVNGAGYGSNIGCGNNNGHPYVAFSCESGTNDNTFKTRGLLGNVIQATATGELKFSQVTNANADNQTATDRLTIDSNGQSTFTRDGLAVTSNRTGSDGDVIHVRKDNYTRLRLTTLGITFPNGGTAPVSAPANRLDYYEEGTWTPSVGGDATYSAQTGRYTRIGRLVTATFDLTINVIGTGSTYIVSGLPFNSASGESIGAGGNINYYASLAVSPVLFAPTVAGSTVHIRSATSAAASPSNHGLLGNSARIAGIVTYTV